MLIHELSIIVPLLNESRTLPRLFETLSLQTGIHFELVAVDGGSDDGTPELFALLQKETLFPCRLIFSERGRAAQMNAGARDSVGEFLLFLHADSRFETSDALAQGVEALKCSISYRLGDCVAGHFAMSFDMPADRGSFGYYYYESKARLDRSGTIHGDQGFLLSRDFFQLAGPFDASLPLLEDDRFADAVRRDGEWILLPVGIITSPRRFESEGLKERQTLNALIMNFAAIGWIPFFKDCQGLYSWQDTTGPLDLLPWFLYIRDLLQKTPFSERLSLWYRTGSYVRSNVWQILFYIRTRYRFGRSLPPLGDGKGAMLDRFVDHLTANFVGNLLAALLVRIWFQRTFRRLCMSTSRHAA